MKRVTGFKRLQFSEMHAEAEGDLKILTEKAQRVGMSKISAVKDTLETGAQCDFQVSKADQEDINQRAKALDTYFQQNGMDKLGRGFEESKQVLAGLFIDSSRLVNFAVGSYHLMVIQLMKGIEHSMDVVVEKAKSKIPDLQKRIEDNAFRGMSEKGIEHILERHQLSAEIDLTLSDLLSQREVFEKKISQIEETASKLSDISEEKSASLGQLKQSFAQLNHQIRKLEEMGESLQRLDQLNELELDAISGLNHIAKATPLSLVDQAKASLSYELQDHHALGASFRANLRQTRADLVRKGVSESGIKAVETYLSIGFHKDVFQGLRQITLLDKGEAKDVERSIEALEALRSQEQQFLLGKGKSRTAEEFSKDFKEVSENLRSTFSVLSEEMRGKYEEHSTYYMGRDMAVAFGAMFAAQTFRFVS